LVPTTLPPRDHFRIKIKVTLEQATKAQEEE